MADTPGAVCLFYADGVVDYERWSALPDGKHIVVLLKETNGLHGSLVEFLYHGGSKTYYRTWNNVARWANMILNGTYWEFVPKSLLDDMVRNIAVVNLKKCPGGAIASSKAVRQAARQDADRLKRQIQLYEPGIILTGGWGWYRTFYMMRYLQMMLNGSGPMKRLHCGITKAVWSAQVKKHSL